MPSIDSLMDTFTHTNKTIVKAKFTMQGCKRNFVCCCELFCDKVVLPLYIQTHWSSALGWLTFIQIVWGNRMPHNYLLFLTSNIEGSYALDNIFSSLRRNHSIAKKDFWVSASGATFFFVRLCKCLSLLQLWFILATMLFKVG